MCGRVVRGLDSAFDLLFRKRIANALQLRYEFNRIGPKK
jgi:hypothetical protein